MADVQKENGYLEFANELVEALARVNLTAYQQRVLWVIWRKTYGWKKKVDEIARSQFKKMTGIDDRHIVRTIKELEQMNMVTVTRQSTKKAIYSFQKDYEAWRLVPNGAQVKRTQLVPNEDSACALSGTKTCASTGTHKRKKETYKRNIVQKLSDKETLSLFFLKKRLPFSASVNAMILEFINRVRLANLHKAITVARAEKIADELAAINVKYGSENMAAGIKAVFKKAEKDNFNFSGHDPTAYTRAVAKSEYSKTLHLQAEAAHHAEREALRKVAPAGNLFDEIQQAINQ